MLISTIFSVEKKVKFSSVDNEGNPHFQIRPFLYIYSKHFSMDCTGHDFLLFSKNRNYKRFGTECLRLVF